MKKRNPKHAAPKPNVAAWLCGALIGIVVKKGVGFIIGWLAPMGWALLTGWFEASDFLPFF